MLKRMTWNEIREKYPNQWVGLTDVEYEEDNISTIRSAIVLRTNKTKSELTLEQINSNGAVIARYTDPDRLFQLGAV